MPRDGRSFPGSRSGQGRLVLGALLLVISASMAVPSWTLLGAPVAAHAAAEQLASTASAPSSASSERPLQAPVALGSPAHLDGYEAPEAVAPTDLLNATITLSPSNLAGLDAYASQAPEPAPLSPAQVQADFGPSAASATALRTYLEREGLSVKAPTDGLVWLLSGSARSFSEAFSTSLVSYAPVGAGSSGRVVAFGSVPQVPDSLPVAAISAPSPVGNLRPLLVGPVDPKTGAIETQGAGVAEASPASPSGLTCPNGSLTPSLVQTAYGIAPVLGSGDKGQGESIGIVDAFDSAENEYRINHDLASFSACYGLPVKNASIAWPVPGPANLNSTNSSGWGLEIALDTQWAHATAPDASITLVLSPNNDYGLYYGVDWLVATRSVDVVSLSWGEPETGIYDFGPCSYDCNATTDGTLATLGPVIASAAAEGMDVFVASGDCGANGGTGSYTPWYPASDPHAIGVGGTTLNVSASGAYESETAWDGTQTFCLNGGGSGGGFSTLPRPGWQTGPGFSRFANSTRGSPDVSLVADVPLGLFYQGANEYVEGTSDAAPQWAGMGALLAEDLASNGVTRGPEAGLPGFLGPVLYSLLRSPQYTDDFHPVQTGWNGYSAGYGWNPVTGIGTPDFERLAASVVAAGFPSGAAHLPSSFPLSASPLAGTSPLPVAFQAAALPGAAAGPAIYTFYYGDTGAPYQEANATTTTSNTSGFLYPASAALNATTPGDGAYTAFVAAQDGSDNTSLSVPVEVNVGNAGPLEVQFSWTTGPAGSPTSFLAAASLGTGPYNYSYFFGDGTYTTAWSAGASVSHTYAENGSYLVTVVANDSSHPQRGGSLTQCVVIGPGPADCPAVPSPLVSDVVPASTHLVDGATTPVKVVATFNGVPVAGAEVALSSRLGGLTVSTGLTNAAGVFFSNLTAPALNATAFFGLFANVTAPGYAPGFGESLLLVDPSTGPSLTPWVRFGQSPATGGSSDAVVVGGLVAYRNEPASFAAVALSWSGAGAGSSSGSMDASGFFTTTWTTPVVSKPTDAVLTATLALPGYTSVAYRFLLPLVPPNASEVPAVALSVGPTTMASMGSVSVTAEVSAPAGGSPLSIGPGNLTLASEPLGTWSGWTQVAPGTYTGLFSTPITPLTFGEILVVNVSANTHWTNASAAGLVQVLGSRGPLALSLTPDQLTPGASTNLTVTVRSAFYGVPLDRSFLLVDPRYGDPSQADNNPVFGWTNDRGNLTLRYTSPNYSVSFGVIVEAVGWYYNYTQVNFSLVIAPPPPVYPAPRHLLPDFTGNGISPTEKWVAGVGVPALALSLGLLLVILWEVRREQGERLLRGRPPTPGVERGPAAPTHAPGEGAPPAVGPQAPKEATPIAPKPTPPADGPPSP